MASRPIMERATLERWTDEQVVERVLAGDGAAFEVIMRRYNQRLYRVARAILVDDSEAEDAIQQIKRIGSAVLQCPADDLEVAGGRVYVRDDPGHGLPLSKVVLGYQYPDGKSIGGQVIGRGNYISRGLTGIDPETGAGNPALEWTLGTEAVEVEVDLADGSFQVLKAVCAMDVGKVIKCQCPERMDVAKVAVKALTEAKEKGLVRTVRRPSR